MEDRDPVVVVDISLKDTLMPRIEPVNSPDDVSNASDDPAALKDRLFELFMERFDDMQLRRTEVVRAVTDGMDAVFRRGDACRARAEMMPILAAMDQILGAAGVETTGVSGKVKIASITMMYLIVLKKWVADDSADLGVTMAELDRRLDQWIRVSAWMG